MTGASKSWDTERLKSGKHELLKKIGAEHIQLQSKTSCKVGAHYLSAATFAKRLEDLGGKRSIFQLKVKDDSIFSGKKCFCEMDGEFRAEMQGIELSIDQQARNEDGSLKIEKHISSVIGENHKVVQDEKTGKFYVIDSLTSIRLSKAGLLNLKDKKLKEEVIIQESQKTGSLLSGKIEFPGIKFEKKNPSQWKEAVKLLEDLKIHKSAWDIVETDEAVYLVPYQYKQKVKLATNDSEVSLVERPTKALARSSQRGTVLLTMNQSDIYEQYTHEMLTFALEGVDVMVYNNPGKGLSTGSADRENINASIEASYQYLKSKNIPDEQILAKGQCFGGAPTAWLGRQHPHINMMLDQNPANFHDIAMEKVNSVAKNLMSEDRSQFTRWVGKILKDNFIINGIARAVFGGYDVPEDLAHNQGHKLLNINIPTARGFGGDQLVPKEHPTMMLDAMSDNKGKVVTLSMNPGALHVTDWWAGNESRDVVTLFLERTGISHSLF